MIAIYESQGMILGVWVGEELQPHQQITHRLDISQIPTGRPAAGSHDWDNEALARRWKLAFLWLYMSHENRARLLEGQSAYFCDPQFPLQVEYAQPFVGCYDHGVRPPRWGFAGAGEYEARKVLQAYFPDRTESPEQLRAYCADLVEWLEPFRIGE